MCEPISAGVLMAASLGISAAQGLAQFAGEQRLADQQYNTQLRNARKTREATIADLVLKHSDLQARQQQEQAATAVALKNSQTAARRAESTARAVTSSSGKSMDMLLADYDRQYGEYSTTKLMQLGWNKEQLNRTKDSVQAQAVSRINGIPMQPIQSPSLGMTMLGIGATGLNTLSGMMIRDPLTGKLTL